MILKKNLIIKLKKNLLIGVAGHHIYKRPVDY